MRYILLALICVLGFGLYGCTDKSKAVREELTPLAFRIDVNEELNSQVYRINYENMDKANEILEDVFGDLNMTDTVKYEGIPVTIETTYKHIDICAYSVTLGRKMGFIVVCRTSDFDDAMDVYKRMTKEEQDSVKKGP